MPPTTMSHYVRAMVERGHLERRRDPQDHRASVLSLTRTGRAAHATAATAFEAANQRFLAALDVSNGSARQVLGALRRAAEDATSQLAADTSARIA
jgi:DNA-binding MarR family transcriptional regulator